jgi:hypothetical protein
VSLMLSASADEDARLVRCLRAIQKSVCHGRSFHHARRCQMAGCHFPTGHRSGRRHRLSDGSFRSRSLRHHAAAAAFPAAQPFDEPGHWRAWFDTEANKLGSETKPRCWQLKHCTKMTGRGLLTASRIASQPCAVSLPSAMASSRPCALSTRKSSGAQMTRFRL